MSEINRAISQFIRDAGSNFLKSPMLFVTGPRQVGKTYLAKKTGDRIFNWDTKEVKIAYLKDPYFFRGEPGWIVFDEIHKRKDWKKLLKGYYDSPSREENFVVTGSGRFNLYQKGGDSLQGRYELFHLYPITLDELLGTTCTPRARDFDSWEPSTSTATQNADRELLSLGGFPHPLLSGSERTLNRWMDLYLKRLIQEDIRDFSKVDLLDKIELLARLLPTRVSSPLSFQSLAEDIEVSRETIKSWIRLFETLYLGVSIPPYHYRIERAVKKERKWYFFQWTFVEAPGARFENYLAIQLLSACQYWRDAGLGAYELHYLRDQDRREVDFLITKGLKPIALIEAKSSPQPWSASLHYYTKKLGVPGFLVYPEGPSRREENKLGFSCSSSAFLKNLMAGK